MYIATNDGTLVFDSIEVVALKSHFSAYDPERTLVYLRNGVNHIVRAPIKDLITVLGWDQPSERSGLDQFVVLESSNTQQ